jgi:hypothetical protein
LYECHFSYCLHVICHKKLKHVNMPFSRSWDPWWQTIARRRVPGKQCGPCWWVWCSLSQVYDEWCKLALNGMYRLPSTILFHDNWHVLTCLVVVAYACLLSSCFLLICISRAIMVLVSCWSEWNWFSTSRTHLCLSITATIHKRGMHGSNDGGYQYVMQIVFHETWFGHWRLAFKVDDAIPWVAWSQGHVFGDVHFVLTNLCDCGDSWTWMFIYK